MLAPVRRVRRRLNALAWTEAGLAPAWATVTACVLARMLLRGHLVWALPPLLLAGLAWWWVRARKRGVSLEYAAVLADRSAQAGGLLLTRLERPVGEWELTVNQLAREVKLPKLEWRRPVAALVGALLFLLVGFLLPLPALRGTRPVHAAAAAKVDAVQAQAEALAREEPLGEAVEEELRRLADEVAAGRFDSGDWEAADSLEQRLAERAAEAAAQLSKAAEAARELEDALGAAGGAESVSREREALERALMELGESQPSASEGTEGLAGASDAGSGAGTESNSGTRTASREGTEGQSGESNTGSREGTEGQAGESNAGTRTSSREGTEGQPGQSNTGSREGSRSQGASRQQAQARAQSTGSVDQISDLRQSLERRRQSLSQPFDSQRGENAQANPQRSGTRRQQQGSRGARQGSRSQGQQGEGEGQGEGQGRSEGQGAQSGGRSGQGHASRAVENRSGSNEVGTGAEGGGHNALVFGGAAEMDPERLAFEALPEGQGGEAGELWGLQAADPLRGSGAMGAGGSRGTSAQGEATEGPGAQPLLPRNRELVKRYFGGK